MQEKAHKTLDFIIAQRYVFAMIFFSVSFSTFAFLYMTGLIPEEFKVARTGVSAQERELDPEEEAVLRAAAEEEGRTNAAVPRGASELPVRVKIAKVGIDTAIVNPASSNVKVLDEELKKGVVRHPASGKLGEGNMLLFGHSTSIRVVNNQSFKAFNNLSKLNPGDEVVIESGGATYLYRAFSVRLTTAEEALVRFDGGRNMVTLSTCNTFGAKQERYVVEADFVKKITRRPG